MLEALSKAAFTHPAIDNHAHNILKAEKKNIFPYHCLAGEGFGDSADDIKHTVAFKRVTRQLATLFSCDPDWDTVKSTRDAMPYEELCRKCFEPTGIQCVLLEDYTTLIEENCEATSSHDRFTKDPTKRLVRLESVAERILLEPALQSATGTIAPQLFKHFMKTFTTRIQDYCKDPNVIGFKSIACYRTGLAIEALHEDTDSVYKAFVAAHKDSKSANPKKNFDLASKVFNDRLVCITLGLAGAAGKPVQFHTGLGDDDIRLTNASSAHLRDVITAFPDTKIVLLHASYPFTQDAGYLASVYKNVFLDVGEIWPYVSATGQRQVIRQIFELCPTNKILWSTDGHYWPETFYLAALQGRQALFEVLSEIVMKGDLTEAEAVEIVGKVLFHNSNRLYGLNLKPITTSTADGTPLSPSVGLSLLDSLPDDITNIRLQWVDYTNVIRYRVIPRDRFRHTLQGKLRGGMALTKAVFYLSQNDAPAEGGLPVGEWMYVPDLGSLRICGYGDGYASVMGYFEGKDGSKCDLCPRGLLRNLLQNAKEEFGITFLAGFETEFILIPQSGIVGRNKFEWCCSKASLCGTTELAIMEAIQKALKKSNIELQYWHAESAPGQYEVVTGPLSPLEAVDALIMVRETVYNIANSFGMHATIAPKVDKNAAGNGAHVHLSIQEASKPAASDFLSGKEASFFQGILSHLISICAFTLPFPASYERVVDGAWSGGTWVAWGRDNKECPLRLCGSPGSWNFEVKALDGTANPYLALSAILSAGISGIAEKRTLTMADCKTPPAGMSESDRKKHGVVQRMPQSVDIAQKSLLQDSTMLKAMGEDLIKAYISVNSHLAGALAKLDLVGLVEKY